MSSRILRSLATGAACLLLAAGCESSSRHGAAGRTRLAPVVVARGEGHFFANTVRAEATVSQVRAVRGGGGGGEGGGRSGGGELGGGGGHHGGGRHRGGYGGSGAPAGGSADDEGPRSSSLRAVGGPELTLRVKFENTSAQPIDIEIRDIVSDLGSFAVRPEHLLLAPGQSSEVDPMVSQLGVVAAHIPVTIVLRAAGKTETQVVPVQALEPVEPGA